MQAEKEHTPSNSGSTKKSGRWRRNTALLLLPWYALIGWLRLAEALRYQDYLLSLNIWPRPLYFAVTGGLIGAGFSTAWLLLLLKINFRRLYSKIFGGVFLVWFWVDRVLFSTREAFINQLLIAFLITAITLLWLFVLVQKKDFAQKEADRGKQT